MSSGKLGDVTDGFICLGNDLALVEALNAIMHEGSEPHSENKEPGRQQTNRELVSAYVDRAVLSSVGQKAFPRYSQQLLQTDGRQHAQVAQCDTSSGSGSLAVEK